MTNPTYTLVFLSLLPLLPMPGHTYIYPTTIPDGKICEITYTSSPSLLFFFLYSLFSALLFAPLPSFPLSPLSLSLTTIIPTTNHKNTTTTATTNEKNFLLSSLFSLLSSPSSSPRQKGRVRLPCTAARPLFNGLLGGSQSIIMS